MTVLAGSPHKGPRRPQVLGAGRGRLGPVDGAGHDHDHAHDPAHEHGHDHRHPGGLTARLRELLSPHTHDPGARVDQALETSSRGIRALAVSFGALALTALLQAGVVLATGSVALLGDTLHNVADALTAVPLGIAFWVGRRPANRRYTYGYGRAEDLAGVVIVATIALSAAAAAYESVRRLVHPADVHHLWAVAMAGVIGFIGNEAVARYRIRVGRAIGSAALVADGLHARTDGFTSLAVVAGAAGVAAGWPAADPVVGLLITLAILAVLRDAARDVYRRLMDAVDPALVAAVETQLRQTPGVLDVGEVRLRWIGHRLRAECEVVVNGHDTVAAGHAVAVAAEHRLMHEVPRLTAALVHADPLTAPEEDHHRPTAHHRERGA